MRLAYSSIDRQPKRRYRAWFAWRPVKLKDTGQWAWLRQVGRYTGHYYAGVHAGPCSWNAYRNAPGEYLT